MVVSTVFYIIYPNPNLNYSRLQSENILKIFFLNDNKYIPSLACLYGGRVSLSQSVGFCSYVNLELVDNDKQAVQKSQMIKE